MDTGEADTRYVKAAKSTTPSKANHKHEYVRVFKMSHIRRFDGTISSALYKFTLPDECLTCGHTKRRRQPDAVEVEVSIREFNKIRADRT